MQLDPVHVLVYAVLGGVFGFLGGLFGIGGATVAIPTLGIAFGMSEQMAQGTAVVMAIPNVLIGLARYTQRARLNLKVAAALAVVAVPMTYVGALIATSIGSRPLRIGFAIFLIVLAADIARRALQKIDPAKRIVLPTPLIGVTGAICGICSGLFSIGGAIVLVSALTTLFGYSQLAAQGMSLAFAASTGLITAAAYASKGDVDWSVSLPLAVGGLFMVPRGVDLAHRLPERVLRLLFMAFAIGVAVALLLKPS